jgi:hypothetical protein
VKTFYSLEDIETLVAQGVRELIVDEDAVLTDVAQDAAVRLGLKLMPKGSGPASSAQSLPAAVAATARPGDAPCPLGSAGAGVRAGGAKPRGCQHGPLGGVGPVATRGQTDTSASPIVARSSGASGNLVDDLVGAVRQMASKGSAG